MSTSKKNLLLFGAAALAMSAYGAPAMAQDADEEAEAKTFLPSRLGQSWFFGLSLEASCLLEGGGAGIYLLKAVKLDRLREKEI